MIKNLKHQTLAKNSSIITLALLMAVATPLGYASQVYADSYDDRINALQNEVSQYQSQASTLKKQAASLQDELDRLTGSKATIQAQIDLSQAKYDKLQQQVKDTEAKIKVNRDALGTIVADMYLDDSISPLEMLASSKNIGDYVDKQQYQSSMQQELQKPITSIKQLKSTLDERKLDVERALTDEKNSREALVRTEKERQILLEQTNGEEVAYQGLSREKQSQADALRSEQIAINMRAAQRSGSQTLVGDVAGGGGYPGIWANPPRDSVVDSWDLYNRECVSYVAWKTASTGRFVPRFNGQGHANQWESYVTRYGIKSGTTPVAGSAAVLYEGPYGHVMYVESVSEDKSRIVVSEYNYGWSGLYSKRSISSAGLKYLYF